MKNEMDDLLNSVFGSRRTLTGTGPVSKDKSGVFPELHADLAPAASEKGSAAASGAAPAPDPLPALSTDAPTHTADALQQGVAQMSDALNARLAAQQEEIAALSQNALADIARIKREIGSPAVQNLAAASADESAAVQPAAVGAEGFEGLAAALGETVLGQTEYLQKLVIAFKRPYVTGHSGSSARNAILITGKPCTGRHLSLAGIAAQLNARGVLTTGDIAWVDLGLYPTPGEEKLFLQDLYMALSASAEIVAFTRYEACHSGFLGIVSALVQRGKSPLSNRYVLQNGRLIDVGTALVQDAVSELTPRGKYLVFVTDRPVSKLADSFGAPFISALGDVCKTQPLTKAALADIASAEFEKLCIRAKETLCYDVTADDAVKALATNAAGDEGGARGLLDYWDKTYRALAQYKLEHSDKTVTAVLCVQNGRPAVCFDGGSPVDLFALLPGDYTGELEQVKAEFDSVIGLDEIKKYILSLEDNYTVQARRKAQGLKTASVSMHMIFTGSPGTGKTTIARLVSKYLKAIGVLSGGQLVEVTRADLVGKYVGHTAPLTTQVIRSAIGGVLFIDEAYSLYRGRDDSFGLEAIDTLVKCMEDNRDNLIVILAGYSKEMAEFLTANSGLTSRFPNRIEFPDYTGAELLSITKLQAKGKGYKLDEACDGVLLPYYNAVQLNHAQTAGNGRLARNKVEEAILNQSKRLIQEPSADLSLLTTQDFVLNDIDSMA
ncbi:MAG: AAA family ATPase [Ruthenibacterium sp.]